MIDILFTLFIYPLIQIMEFTFVGVDRIFKSEVLGIAGISVAVTVCTFPLYIMAEKWQNLEREIQKRMSPMLFNIKAVFKRDERFMLIQEYYRQNNYHPLYSLRNSFGILIQIPFFIAAYSFLSNLDYIHNMPFFLIKSLGKPDSLITVGSISLNLLPILMTAINCVSTAIYTRNFLLKEKLQLYGMAAIFLILLYNSPSCLVLYWIMNNALSLIKNIMLKLKNRKLILYVLLCVIAASTDIFFIYLGLSPKRIFVACLASLLFFIPLFYKGIKILKNIILSRVCLDKSILSDKKTYIYSLLILLVLSGLVIPGALISSSVEEFSFLDSYTTPLPFIFNVFLQSIGIFLIWPLCIYFLFPKKIKMALTFIVSLVFIIALLNTFLFPGDYGYLTTTFKFSNPDTIESKYGIIALNFLASLAAIIIFGCLLFTKMKIIFASIQQIVLIALTIFGIFSIYKIGTEFKAYSLRLADAGAGIEQHDPVYSFSKEGKNVIVLMLDGSTSGFLPYIFSEKPELLESFSGFTFYPNCVSFGRHTRIGVPAIFGGYEYQPLNIQKNRNFARQKHNEALLMMPLMFSDAGYRVTSTDPSFSNYSWTPDLSIFAPYPEITAKNTIGKYTGEWLRAHPDIDLLSVPDLLKDLLLRFSLLKMSPPAFRVFIYDLSNWMRPAGNLTDNQLSIDTIDNYIALDYLPQNTGISPESFNTYIAITNDLIHYPSFFQYPDYLPAKNVIDNRDEPIFKVMGYHNNMAAILMVGKWLDFLKKSNVYDNSRIIIVSDHGRSESFGYPGNIILPDGIHLSRYNCLLLVKDFDQNFEMATDYAFMTQGDVPLLAMNGIIDAPINPFSDEPIVIDKENGIYIATTGNLQFEIPDDQWLFVKDDIFTLSNWERVHR